MKLTAYAVRSEGWWLVTVPEIDGLFVRALRLRQIPALVTNAAAGLTGRPESFFEVEVVPDISPC